MEPASATPLVLKPPQKERMDNPIEAPQRDRWRTLTPEQRALADALMIRAEKLHADADGELSIAEAVAVAAAQLGYPLNPVGARPAYLNSITTEGENGS